MRALAVVALLGGPALLSGCFGTSSGYVEADFTPDYVGDYPQSYYDGHVVYLIGDRWYFHDRGAWFYIREEPPVLYRYRLHRGHPHPHHHHGHFRHEGEHHHHREAPPGRRYREQAPPARSPAPPARRVR